MIQRGVFVRTLRRHHGAGLRFGGAKYYFSDSRVDHRAHAHQTGLDGHIQRRTCEPVIARRERRGGRLGVLDDRRAAVRLDVDRTGRTGRDRKSVV